MSNSHDHKSKVPSILGRAPRTSPSMNIAGRPSVIAHDDGAGTVKSVHTNKTRGRASEKIAEPQYGERDDGYKDCPPS